MKKNLRQTVCGYPPITFQTRKLPDKTTKGSNFRCFRGNQDIDLWEKGLLEREVAVLIVWYNDSVQASASAYTAAMWNMRSAGSIRPTEHFSAAQINFENSQVMRAMSVLKTVLKCGLQQVHIRITSDVDNRPKLFVLVFVILIRIM